MNQGTGIAGSNFSPQVISTTADGAASVFAADVDGDGDTDILSASENDDKIAWYENNIPIPPQTINLTINPTSVTEDGSTNLTYTFSRITTTTDSLTVNFSVGGDAIFNNDYTQSGASRFNATEGSITFAAGSTTAATTAGSAATSMQSAPARE